MATKIFVNLPVKDLKKSMDFFNALGYSFNPQFTDENAACLVFSEHIYAMLLTEPMFTRFTPKNICDAHTSTEAIIALSVDSRVEVEELVNKALKAGGTQPMPAQDHGFMYQSGFQDLDGHMWEVLWMDPANVK